MFTMIENDDLQHISSVLTDWYKKNKRDLPWRNIHDPYRIWISEIILQQTRVAQGYDYYLKFTQQFPDVQSLANAPEDEVLKCWQGLGYYSRARNLQAAAKRIMAQHNGKFPSNYDDILALKGIGEYTAAAISSFAFKQPYAVVDGNVFRFLSRYFGIDSPIDSGAGKKQFAKLAGLLLDKLQPDLHNQAIMEFGALQCTPTGPDCMNCPLETSCFAKEQGKISDLPVKEKKTRVTHRFFHHLVFICGEETLLSKRSDKDIWQNLYEFPLYESTKLCSFEEILMEKNWISEIAGLHPIHISYQSKEIKHILSHQIIHAVFYVVNTESTALQLPHFTPVKIEHLNKYPISRLTEKFLKKFSENLSCSKNKYIFTAN
ncbi:A/G-specific adenine glycosylase [Paludibacter jiangxiensis]|uniref:Adenine DNA glycosylase n=2 Tax=Paludibacter jiangxiensis TaxID=681398 RepID=A0A171A7Q2_9BACT|nr:A/G-specific adenine glycosylase [Paludibacter jiangxiensis]